MPNSCRICRDIHGSGAAAAGPGTLVEPAEDNQVGLLQPCLDKAPDRQPRMSAIARAHHHAGGQRLEQCWVVPAGHWRKTVGGVDQLVAEARGGLAGRVAPQPRHAALGIGGGEPLGRRDMRRGQLGERHAASVEQLGQHAETTLQPVDEAAQRRLAVERRPQPGKAGRRARPADRGFQPAGAFAKGLGCEPAGRQRVLQRREQRHRCQRAVGQVEHQAQERAGRGAVERHAGQVVDVDVPSAHLGGDPAGQLAVRRHQRRRRAGGLQIAAQQ